MLMNSEVGSGSKDTFVATGTNTGSDRGASLRSLCAKEKRSREGYFHLFRVLASHGNVSKPYSY